MKSRTFNAGQIIKSASLVSELIDHRVFDESAESIKEMVTKSDGRLRYRDAARQVENLLIEGRIEKVWKHGPVRAVPAFRIIKEIKNRK